MSDSLTVYFSGDTCLNGAYADNLARGKHIFSDSVIACLENADFHVTNLEGPVNNSGTRNSITNPEKGLHYLADHHISVFNLANNHLFDMGVSGFNKTKEIIDKVEAISFGAGNNVNEASNVIFLEKNDVTLGLVSVCDDSKAIADKHTPGVLHLDHQEILFKSMHQAKEKVDFLGLIVHLGEEYTLVPSPRKKKIIKSLIRRGAPDFVIAHHSHTFQSVQHVGNIPVFYSLGNFIFDWPTHKYYPYTDVSAIVQLHFTKSSIDYSFFPVLLDRENGRVDSQNPSDWDVYFDKTKKHFSRGFWRKEANRVVFKRLKLSQTHTHERSATQKSKNFGHIFHRMITILGNQTLRDIYIPALIYRFQKIFQAHDTD